MKEYEDLIKARFANRVLPKNIIHDYIAKAKEKGIILDDELVEIPQDLTLEELKKKLTEYRRAFFESTLDSFNCDFELEEIYQIDGQNKENQNNSNKQAKMSKLIEKEKVKEYDETDRISKKERRLRNILNAYYEYEISRILEEEKEPEKPKSSSKILFLLVFVVLGIGVFVFLDYIDFFRPF